MRRGAFLQLVVIALLAAAGGVAIALLVPWLPKPASREAGRIDFVFWLTVGICIFVFSIVASMMLYAILHFRAKPDDDSDGPPIHGHTGLEIGWTAVPTVLVTVIAIVSAIVLARDDRAGAHPMRIEVTAQQFAWSFTYPGGGEPVTQAILRLPVNRSVVLRFTAKDVIHSFWVPEFGQKQDTVPGLHPTLHITPDRVGVYPVICTELCGLGHAVMRTTAIVMPVAAFDKWLAGQRKGGQASPAPTPAGGSTGGGSASAGKGIFAANGCGACHTLTAAGAAAKVGPDLDKLPAEAKQAGQPLEAFIRESIVKPNAYIQPGYPKGVMPQTFGTTLSKSQLDSLVQFLISSSTKG
jgi:cytochrome c oxidase subunit 2